MVLTDVKNRFIRVNTAFAHTFGYSVEQLLGMTMEDITHPDHLAESYERRMALDAGESTFFQMEKRYLHKDGHVLWGLANVALVRGSRRPSRCCTSARCRISPSASEPWRHSRQLSSASSM